VRLALQAGITQDVIDAIAERKTPRFTDPDDQLVYDFAHSYYQNHRVDQATYDRVVKRCGDKGVVDLAGLIGYYSFVSVTLNVFEVPTPPGAKLLEK
jgi:4-carboxymuconolactone decarboxylase